jgi:hypothetical protein
MDNLIGAKDLDNLKILYIRNMLEFHVMTIYHNYKIIIKWKVVIVGIS